MSNANSQFCLDCKMQTEVVFDHKAGDTICSECGLVLESRSVEETCEWRTFSTNDDSSDRDPNRVGSAINPLLADAALTTKISNAPPHKAKSGSANPPVSSAISRWQRTTAAHSDRGLIHGFHSIDDMADRLGLVTTIQDHAKEMFKKLEDQKLLKGRNHDAILAACLYIACRLENKPRTIKEICSLGSGFSKKDLGRAIDLIMKNLKVELGTSATIHGVDYMRRFGSHLGMTNRSVKAAQEAIQLTEELDIRRSPVSMMAAVIYIIIQLSDDKKPLKDIAIVTQVAEGTMKNVYKDLYPHLSQIVPSWFATEGDIMKMPAIAS